MLGLDTRCLQCFEVADRLLAEAFLIGGRSEGIDEGKYATVVVIHEKIRRREERNTCPA